MRNILIILFIFVFSGSALANKKAKLAELEQALNAHHGKIVYLDFWASWCIPCKASFPWMNQMQDSYQSQGLKIITVNLDVDRKNADTFLAQHPANFDIIYDGDGVIARQFKLPGMPSSMLFDRNGKLVATHAGFNQQKKAKYQQKILQLLAQ